MSWNAKRCERSKTRPGARAEPSWRSPSPGDTMNKIAFVGVAFDEFSSYLRGPAEAPAAIRRALTSDSSNSWSEDGMDVEPLLEDCGNLRGFTKNPVQEIEEFLARSVSEFPQLLVLGGDHSITFPAVQAVARKHGPVNIVHFD